MLRFKTMSTDSVQQCHVEGPLLDFMARCRGPAMTLMMAVTLLLTGEN